jgi:hypothetical protein
VVILENFCIFLKELASLETELPTLVKSMLPRLFNLSLGDKSKCTGELTCANLFFFW